MNMKSNFLIHRSSIHILRVTMSGIFLVASISHLTNVEGTVARIENAPMKGFALFFGDPRTLVILSGIAMLIAGISFLIGYRTRWAAIVLIAILIPITLTIQVGQMSSLGPLFKNIAIFGGLLFFAINDFDSQFKIQKT